MGKKLVIYGAGKMGNDMYSFLKYLGVTDNVYGFCDKRYMEVGQVEDKKVFGLEELKDKKVVYYVALGDEEEKEKLEKELHCIKKKDLPQFFEINRAEFNRKYCAFFHIDAMEGYFENAEKEDAIKTFWAEDSEFYQMFRKLDLTNVIELACGRGRHVPHYMDKAEKITLVDILEKNIEWCKKRFENSDKIVYYKNNGYDLEELETGKYTALFSYDAMVHFEMLDIYSYLKDIYRVLEKGGMALLHHSNYCSDYKVSFSNSANDSGRNFMSKMLFAYLADRAGFEVVEQKVIDWEVPELDCISLIKKL